MWLSSKRDEMNASAQIVIIGREHPEVSSSWMRPLETEKNRL